MTLLQTTTAAYSQAQRNLAANLDALSRTQSHLLAEVADQELAIEWVLGRDGALTALDEAGHWWAGCSLPRCAAQVMLKKLDVRGGVACFLAPPHAAHIRTALDNLRPEQAVVAVVPERRELAAIFHCEDFTADIAAHRLWFAAGDDWDAKLRALFDEHEGLATPSQFIRTPDAEAQVIENLIATAQQVFSQVTAARSAATQELRRSAPARVSTPRLCVVAPSQFRLWNDIGHAMRHVLAAETQIKTVYFDPDDPASSAPLALARIAHSCSAIFTANTARSDLPGLLPETLPWITWVTGGRVPSGSLAGVDDHLILCDARLRETALKSGWRDSKIHIGGWPQSVAATPPVARAVGSRLFCAIIADTVALDTPKDLTDYSSHSLLWEAIRNELAKNPFVLTDVNAFLNQRIAKLGVAEEQDRVPRLRFIEKLILPAYQQGVARSLIRANVPLRLFGSGWDELAEYASHAAGPIRSRQEFNDAVTQCSAILHVWPAVVAHPLDAMKVPVVRCFGRRGDEIVRDAKAASNGTVAAATCMAPLKAELIRRICGLRTI